MIDSELRHVVGDSLHGSRVHRSSLSAPGFAKRLKRYLLFIGKNVADCVKKCKLLHPAARKRIHRQNSFNERVLSHVVGPALQFCLFNFSFPRFAHLIEQHDDRFADPGKNLHFGCDVRAGLGRFACVH